MDRKNPFPEVTEALVGSGAETLQWCMQCGMCTAACPWRLVKGEISEKFNNRKMQHMGQMGVDGYEDEDVLYACTTCGVCVTRCPRQTNAVANTRVMRSLIVETSGLPKSVRPTAGSLHDNGNPWQGARADRLAWAKGLDIPAFGPDKEYLLYVCCTSCYDKRSMKVARAVARVLKHAGVSFGVIGAEENCCGESIRKLGGEAVFQEVAAKNVELFKSKGVKKIITTSPHCLWSFTYDYPEFGGEWEVVHYSELFARLMQEGKLKLEKPLEGTISFHDPCYLGRHSGVVDEPRALAQALPNVTFKELSRNRKDSLCCGGGGGRVWMETPAGARFGDLRVYEALEQGANVLATSCPYCIIMLEASAMALGKDEQLKVRDLSELIAEATVGGE
ncbi:MAG: (Fe-S)-binding protein [Myxococcales bacterium]|nr:MAG: (Fe-S)-binding protein [Myxococcales bacterium]